MKKLLVATLSALLMSTAVWAVTDTTTTQNQPVTTTTTAAKATAPTIAVVNMTNFFKQSTRIAELTKSLQSKFKPQQDKLAAQQKALQDELDKFKKDSSTMNQKDKDALQKKIVDDQGNLARDAAAFQQELNKEQGKIMKTVMDQLNEVISNIAKKNNFTLVLDSQSVIYSQDSTDITKQVTTEFDKK